MCNNCRIVLVEDNAADVHLIQIAIRRMNLKCELVVYQNGADAEKALCASPTNGENLLSPNVILLDMNTPKCDGFEVLEKFRNTPSLTNTSIAIISSSQARSDLEHIKSLGGVRYIQKPSQLNDFLDSVGQAIKEMIGETSSTRLQ